MIDNDELTGEDLALQEQLSARVDALGESLRKKRDAAVSARRDCGIEDEWRAAEDAYQGVDDHNRGDSRMAKPTSPNGGISNVRTEKRTTRSTVVLNITRPYVDAAAARVGDMMLPTDDSPWAIRPSPVPSMTMEALPPPEAPPGMPEMGAPPGMPGMPPSEPEGVGGPPEMPQMGAPPGMPAPGGQPNQLTETQQADADEDRVNVEAKDRAKRATKQIEDWLVECQWHAEVRKMIEDAARLGTGILKGPTPRRMQQRKMTQEGGFWSLVIDETITPESRCISPWNFFPDGGCGESVQDGAYTWEVDTLSGKALRELKGGDYIDAQIDKCLDEGPQSATAGSNGYQGAKVKTSDKDLFQVWYFHGLADREDLEAAGVDIPDGDVVASCIVTMVNDRVIKAALNPLDSGDFPYDMMPWQRKAGLPYGTGVAMQINTPQRMLTSAARNLMDNAGLSAGPQIVMRKGVLTPADGRYELTPRKLWWVAESADAQGVEQAFKVFNIPTMQAELNNIIQFAMKMAEDVTGMPAMMQGQGTHAPDTVGGMQMLQNNAGTVLRRIARLFDDQVTEPHIRRYYEWLMLNQDDDTLKGDFVIDARGSTALVERDMQTQAILQMGALVGNPAFGIDPEKWAMEMLKSQRLDPKSFLLDDEKKNAMQGQPPPEPPQLAVAKLRAEADAAKTQATLAARAQEVQLENETRQQIAQITQSASVEKMRMDTDRDAIYVQAQANRDQIAHDSKMAELQLKRELAMLDYANREKVSLESVKADLAKEAMKINATKELAGMKASSDLMPKPPVEPPQRAKPGESYQQ